MASSSKSGASSASQVQPVGAHAPSGTVFANQSDGEVVIPGLRSTADSLLTNQPDSSAVVAPSRDAPYVRRHRQRRTTLPRSTRGWSRAIVWSLIGVTGVGVLYGMFGRIDRTVNATGTLRPVGGVTAVSSPVSTVVEQVLVKGGDVVKEGDPLLIFDQGSLKQQRNQLISQKKIWTKEKVLLAVQLGIPVDPQISAEAQRELDINTYEVNLRSRGATAERERSRITIRQQEDNLAALRQKYAINEGIADRMRGLIAQGAMAKLELDRQEERQIELLSTIKRTEKEIEADRQRLVQSTVQEEQVPVANLKKLYAEYDNAQQQLSDVTNRLIDTEERLRLGKLLAPVSGKVFDISVKPGEVPRGDKPLMKIVPQGSLEAELKISNLDIGHLDVGMPVDVRVNSFPFTEYGALEGKLASIGADSKEATQEVPMEHFIAVAKLDGDSLTKDGKTYNLRPGMAITGLIQMGTRPAISLISDRFKSFMDAPNTIR
ncbi:HlyD family efflux transporter periplasmic adaptor subunit [Synechococcus sp. CBW1107]|uniref:HlyD family efflux transporter periplasmic adaptor subunit n=1 Tax=Synechococcus sp. CBW1107 TaxID=2789857 RepID=UPI002AD28C96|nr:HlyD family efflux transporter periplasmic adaptor subunit [Synechococcus sp. CBW1107]CAK6690913.1 hypothetical protein IFHNHDMJ_00910 [Synechococcus sp. CBW1107]